MRLTLGDSLFDLATRSVVIGVLDAGAETAPQLCERAKELVAQGADVVELNAVWTGGPERAQGAVVALVGSLGTPVGIATKSPEVARAALAAGAVFVGEAGIETVAQTGATLVVTAPGDDVSELRDAVVTRARQAEAAGIPPDRIVVDPGLHRTPQLLGQAKRFAELGYPLLLSDARPAAIALAVAGGCRLVRTSDVRGARRVCDVLAAILEAP